MFFLLLLCSSGLAECLPRGARWTEGNIDMYIVLHIIIYITYYYSKQKDYGIH